MNVICKCLNKRSLCICVNKRLDLHTQKERERERTRKSEWERELRQSFSLSVKVSRQLKKVPLRVNVSKSGILTWVGLLISGLPTLLIFLPRASEHIKKRKTKLDDLIDPFFFFFSTCHASLQRRSETDIVK